MVQDVIPLKAKLHVQPFCKLGPLEEGKIELTEVGAEEGITPLVPEMHGVSGRRTERAVLCRRIAPRRIRNESRLPQLQERAGNSERAQLQEVIRIILVINNR